MTRTWRALTSSAIIAGLVVSSAACSSGSNTKTKSADGLQSLTLSIPPVGDSLPVYVALDRGYFKEEGLDIKLTPAANGATTINALIARSTDLALVSYPSLIKAYAAGLAVTIAAPAINGTPAYKACVYVPQDSPIQKPSDMLGKKMATPSLGSVGDIFFRGVLLDDGLPFDQVKFVEIPQANMASALKAGDVDAAFMTEPTLSSAEKALPLRSIACQEGPQGLFATSKELVKSNPKAIKAFRAALVKGMNAVAKDPHGVAEEEMPKHTKLDAATAKAMHLPQYVTQYDPAGVQKVIDLMVREKLLDKSFSAGDLYTAL